MIRPTIPFAIASLGVPFADAASPPLIALFVDALLQFLRPSTLLSVIISGLAKASLYIMIAAGLSLIFGLMGVLNFAHGAVTMIGAYLGGLAMVLMVSGATPPFVRLALFFVAAAIVMGTLALFGSAVEVGLVRRLYDRPPIYQILLTFGIALILEEAVRIVLDFYGMQPRTDWQAALGTKPNFFTTAVTVGPVDVRWLALFEIALGAATVAAIWGFLTRTRYGMFIRAGSEDDEMTAALGIDVRRVFTVVFALGTGLAGLAGTLLMWDSLWGASVPLATHTLLPAFVVVIIGGLGSFRGTVVAGILVGLVDATMTWWFVNAVEFAGLPELTIFLILVVTLIVRPKGLFGVEEVGGH